MNRRGVLSSDVQVLVIAVRGPEMPARGSSQIYTRNGVGSPRRNSAARLFSPPAGDSATSATFITSAASINWKNHFDRLTQFRDLEPGWDSYKAAPPSEPTLARARLFLDYLQRLNYPPAQLTPSVVGGVGFSFRRTNRKVYVEFTNKGSVHALFSDGSSKPVVEKITPNEIAYRLLIGKTKAYLDE